MVDLIFDVVSLIFSWEFIVTLIVIADIYCLCTLKRGSVWKYRKLYNTDINLILNSIKNMDGRQFEEFIAFLFKLEGHDVVLTPQTNDHGVDVLIDENTYIECKHWNMKHLIGREIVSKLVGSAYALSGGKDFNTIVITTGQYHRNALDYAELTNTKLWDINDIVDVIKKLDTTEILRYLNYDRKIWESKEIKRQVVS